MEGEGQKSETIDGTGEDPGPQIGTGTIIKNASLCHLNLLDNNGQDFRTNNSIYVSSILSMSKFRLI